MLNSDARFWAGLFAAATLVSPAAADHTASHDATLGATLVAGAAPSTTPTAPKNPAVDDAIAFAKKMTAEATAVLTKPGATEAQKLDAFEGVLSRSLALDVIGKFMLGDNRKKMSAAQIARYDAVFPDYMTRQYADQFKDIVGRPLEVLEAKALGAKDVIVRTQFKRTEGSPIMVDWRVRKLKTGEQKMIDIIVAGVSIMLVKREEFSSFIATNGIDALLARLEQEAKTASVDGPGVAGIKAADRFYDLEMKRLDAFAELFTAMGGSSKFPTTKHIALVEDAIKEQLIDPSSAEFYDVKEIQVGNSKFICGQVNSKNRLGGYVGRRPFIGAGSQARVQSHEDNSSERAFSALYADRCIRTAAN